MNNVSGNRKLSIIIPALNEAAQLGACLSSLQPLRQAGHEVIVADGGSRDDTVALASPLADHVIVCSGANRALQMNRGAERASGGLYVFLHADTLLPANAEALLMKIIQDSNSAWGRFDVRLSGRGPALRVIEWFMNVRSRLTGIATGDQAIFVTKDLFKAAGGFPDIAIMEDITLSGELKKRAAPLCLKEKVTTSSRRWEQYGIVHTVLRMWLLRARYYLGADPDSLARRYDYRN